MKKEKDKNSDKTIKLRGKEKFLKWYCNNIHNNPIVDKANIGNNPIHKKYDYILYDNKNVISHIKNTIREKYDQLKHK